MTKLLTGINNRKFTNNTQKVAYRLLQANGEWVSSRELARTVTSVGSRVRDLRKEEFGSFTVECVSAQELNRNAKPGTFYYRIVPSRVTRSQVVTVFRV